MGWEGGEGEGSSLCPAPECQPRMVKWGEKRGKWAKSGGKWRIWEIGQKNGKIGQKVGGKLGTAEDWLRPAFLRPPRVGNEGRN